MTGPFADRLLAAVGAATTDPAALQDAAVDRSGVSVAGLPLAVVHARGVEDVQRTLRLAHEHRTPVVPRGAGTGLAGGAVAGPGSVVLDLRQMNRIRSIDADDEIAVVEAGVITADLDRAARAHGLRYAPDPASADRSTIGGNLATNAGGMRCVKYGVTRDAALGLEVVLADGRLIRTGRSTRKGVAGYDLTALLVGSEGTLGVIVGATLRLVPLPGRVVTVAAWFPTVEDAAEACTRIARERLQPSLLELLDRATIDVIDRAQGTDLASRGHALVIAQADGAGALDELEGLTDVLGATATRIDRATDPRAAEELLFARRQALPSIERFGRALIEDICVPRSRLAEAVRGVEAIAARTGVDVYTFAHAGDGNLHPIIAYDRAADAPPKAVEDAAARIFSLALELGGTVTGEHGIGLLKRAWVEAELDPGAIDVQHAIKAALDPTGILNPGKAL